MSRTRPWLRAAVYSRHATTGVVLVALALFVLVPMVVDDPLIYRRLYIIGIATLTAIGLNIAMGRSGELFLGVSGLYTAGAYISAVLTATYGWPFWAAALPFSLIVTSGIGVLVGTIGLRVSSWYFAIITFYISIIVPDLAIALRAQTGGALGLSGIPPLHLFGHELGLRDTYLFVVAAIVMLLLVARNLFRSPWGLAFATLASSEIAMEGLGVSRVRAKLLTYFIATVPASLAGSIYAHHEQFITPNNFSPAESFFTAAAVVVGGLGTLLGPVVGMLVLRFPPTFFDVFEEYELFIYGSFLIVVVLLIPHGIVPTFEGWVVRARDRLLGPPPARPIAIAGGSGGAPEIELNVVPRDLRADGVSKAFGGVTALRDVDFRAQPGQITGLIGANGSGKTTFLNVVLGYYSVDEGAIHVGPTNVTARAPHRVVASGVARTFQTPQIVPTLSVIENVQAGMFLHRHASLPEYLLALPRARAAAKRARLRAHALLGLVGLDHLADAPGATLPTGHRRLLEIARAVASSPSVLLLDEPASGLSGAEVLQLAQVLRRLRDEGMTIVLVEHNVPFVMSLVDRVTVLDAGSVIAHGTSEEVQRDPIVIASYLGEQLTTYGAP